MTPVIQAHSGGLFAAGWTPVRGGVWPTIPLVRGFTRIQPLSFMPRGLLFNVRALFAAATLEQVLEARWPLGGLPAL